MNTSIIVDMGAPDTLYKGGEMQQIITPNAFA